MGCGCNKGRTGSSANRAARVPNAAIKSSVKTVNSSSVRIKRSSVGSQVMNRTKV